jgi:hypothetical protein
MIHARLASLFTLVACLSACQMDNLGGGPKLTAGAGGMDMFSPVKMRVHPLSRIVPAADKNSPTVLEARLEFTDQFSDVTKSPGAVYFELFKYESLTPSHHGDRIHLANFDLGNPESNKEHWDGITRTYLFKIPLPADSLGKESRVVLSATISFTGDGRLNDDLVINLK